VNGVGDYNENIQQRRSGWVKQAEAGIAAYLVATQPATSQEGEARQEAIAMARRCQQARHSAVEPVERDNVLNEAATLLRRLAATPTPPTLSVESHSCPACPIEPRDIGAVLHNLVGQLERGDSVLDGRAKRKLADAKAALARWRPIVDAHFAAQRTAHNPVTPTPDYHAAWAALSVPLSWMHDNPRLKSYWGWNLADIAVDLIDKAYPGLRSGEIVGTTEETVNAVINPVDMLIAWARDNQARPDNHPGGSGWGHIDENARFRLRDMIAAIDAVKP